MGEQVPSLEDLNPAARLPRPSTPTDCTNQEGLGLTWRSSHPHTPDTSCTTNTAEITAACSCLPHRQALSPPAHTGPGTQPRHLPNWYFHNSKRSSSFEMLQNGCSPWIMPANGRAPSCCSRDSHQPGHHIACLLPASSHHPAIKNTHFGASSDPGVRGPGAEGLLPRQCRQPWEAAGLRERLDTGAKLLWPPPGASALGTRQLQRLL